MNKIFLSHSKKDISIVQLIKRDLAENGFEVWFDEDSIKGGDSIIEKISTGFSHCDTFCLVNSKNSIQSGWVDAEIKQFYSQILSSQKQKKIIVLRIDNSEIPDYLSHLLYIDFRDYSAGIKKLINALPQKATLQKSKESIAPSNILIESFIDPTITATDLYAELKRNIFEEKEVDQKFLYWNVDSSRLWVNLCQHSEYPLYDRSISILSNKFASEVLPFLNSLGYQFDEFVNIGVGSGRKDYIILKALLNRYGQAKYIPIDISFSMLQETIKHVLPLLEDADTKLNIKAIVGKVESLKRYKNSILSNDSIGKIYGFLGSNISGFRENIILDIFYKNMSKKDVLLLEVDWIGNRPDSEIKKGYSDRNNKEFIWQPLSFMGLKKPVDWSSRFKFSFKPENSDIPDSRSLISEYVFETGEVIQLASSTKYDKYAFLDHIKDQIGFNVIREFKNNDFFSLLVLGKMPNV